MTLDGETVLSVPRCIHNPHAIALALLDIDTTPRHLGPSDEAPGAIDETRIGNTFVRDDIAGIEILGGGLEQTDISEASVRVVGAKDEGGVLTAGAGSCHQSASVMIVPSSSTSYNDLCGSSGSYGTRE